MTESSSAIKFCTLRKNEKLPHSKKRDSRLCLWHGATLFCFFPCSFWKGNEILILLLKGEAMDVFLFLCSVFSTFYTMKLQISLSELENRFTYIFSRTISSK